MGDTVGITMCTLQKMSFLNCVTVTQNMCKDGFYTLFCIDVPCQLQGNRDSGAAFEGKKQQLAFEMSEIGKNHILPSEKIYKMVLMNIAT